MSQYTLTSPIPNLEDVTWSTIEPSIVQPIARHEFTVILCHGRGSTGRNFKDEIFMSTSSTGKSLREHFPSVKWVFPSAGLPFDPREPVEYGAEWFDISSLQDPDHERERQDYGISESVKYLQQIIQQEVRILGESTSRVILGGIVSHPSLTESVAVGSMLIFPTLLILVGVSSMNPKTLAMYIKVKALLDQDKLIGTCRAKAVQLQYTPCSPASVN